MPVRIRSVTRNALLAQPGRGASLRRKRFRVRISGGARSEAGRSRPIGSARARRFACPRPPLHWRVNRSGNRASLLTSARVTPWDSSSPLSAPVGDEITRGWSPSGKRVGVGVPCGSCPPSSAIGEATRLVTGPAPKAVELRPCEFDSRPLRFWKRKQTGDCTRFEPGRASALSVRFAPLPLTGNDPAGRRGLSDTQLAAWFDSRVAHWPVAKQVTAPAL